MYKKFVVLLDRHKCVPYNTNKQGHKSVLMQNAKGERNMENTMKMYVTADEAAQILTKSFEVLIVN